MTLLKSGIYFIAIARFQTLLIIAVKSYLTEVRINYLLELEKPGQAVRVTEY